jgi:hypothetical protein
MKVSWNNRAEEPSASAWWNIHAAVNVLSLLDEVKTAKRQNGEPTLSLKFRSCCSVNSCSSSASNSPSLGSGLLRLENSTHLRRSIEGRRAK